MTRTHVLRSRRAALVALTLLAPRVAAAQDSIAVKNHLYDTFQLTADFTTVLNFSEARVDGSDGNVGTNLDLKEMLGIAGTSVQPRAGLRWKPGRHTEFEVGYQFLNQSGDRHLTDTLVVGDDTLSGSADVSTKLGASNATLQFRYSLIAAERHNIGLTIGLGGVFFRLDMEASDSLCGGPSCSGGESSISKRVTIPTADIGVFGRWRLGEQWYVGGDARAIGAKVDRYKGSIFEGDAIGQYYWSNRWGIEGGVSYTAVTVDVSPKSGGTSEGDSFAGKIKYAYTSLRLGVVGVF